MNSSKSSLPNFFLLRARSTIDTLLNKIFNDRFDDPLAKRAILVLVNYNLRCLFILQELSLGPKVVEQTESQLEKEEMKNAFSKSQLVTYNYLAGKMRLFNHDFAEADRHLTFAFNNCLRTSLAHKRKILFLLIVVRIVRGGYPSPLLLQKYGFTEPFLPLMTCLIAGNYREYQAILEKNSKMFFETQTFFVMKYRTEILSFRNLFFNSVSILRDNKLSCDILLVACRVAGFSTWQIMNEADVEATLVALIDEGLIKGYLVHGRKILYFLVLLTSRVLSKADPFPSPYLVYSKKFGNALVPASQ